MKMLKKCVLAGLVLLCSVYAVAGQYQNEVAILADRLIADQSPIGNWGEPGFTGEAVIGLVQAYQITGNVAYKQAAEQGGQAILDDPEFATYGPYGAEAYALTRLSEISDNAASNQWRTAAENFYTQVQNSGTANYISSWSGQDKSEAMYDIARHTVSASYLNIDTNIWRQGVLGIIEELDSSNAPVMGLGMATWALSSSGGLGTDFISTTTGSPWSVTREAHLPNILAGYHDDLDGSFFTTFELVFDSGYTETTAMALLGLIDANGGYTGGDFDDLIAEGLAALVGGIGANGDVYWKIGDSSEAMQYFLMGQTLEVIPEPASVLLLGMGALALLKRKRSGKEA